jgi:hypothetical protein
MMTARTYVSVALYRSAPVIIRDRTVWKQQRVISLATSGSPLFLSSSARVRRHLDRAIHPVVLPFAIVLLDDFSALIADESSRQRRHLGLCWKDLDDGQRSVGSFVL